MEIASRRNSNEESESALSASSFPSFDELMAMESEKFIGFTDGLLGKEDLSDYEDLVYGLYNGGENLTSELQELFKLKFVKSLEDVVANPSSVKREHDAINLYCQYNCRTIDQMVSEWSLEKQENISSPLVAAFIKASFSEGEENALSSLSPILRALMDGHQPQDSRSSSVMSSSSLSVGEKDLAKFRKTVDNRVKSWKVRWENVEKTPPWLRSADDDLLFQSVNMTIDNVRKINEGQGKIDDFSNRMIDAVQMQLDSDRAIYENLVFKKISKFHEASVFPFLTTKYRDAIQVQEERQIKPEIEFKSLMQKRAEGIGSTLENSEIKGVMELSQGLPDSIDFSKPNPPLTALLTRAFKDWNLARSVDFARFDPSGIERLIGRHLEMRDEELDNYREELLSKLPQASSIPLEERTEAPEGEIKKKKSRHRKKKPMALVQPDNALAEIDEMPQEAPENLADKIEEMTNADAPGKRKKRSRKKKLRKILANLPKIDAAMMEKIFIETHELNREEMISLLPCIPLDNRRIGRQWLGDCDMMRHLGRSKNPEEIENYFDSSDHDNQKSKNFEWNIAEKIAKRFMEKSPFLDFRHKAARNYAKIQSRKLEDVSTSIKLSDAAKFVTRKRLLSEIQRAEELGAVYSRKSRADAIFYSFLYLEHDEPQRAEAILKEAIVEHAEKPLSNEKDPRKTSPQHQNHWERQMRNMFDLLSKCYESNRPQAQAYRSDSQASSDKFVGILAQRAKEFAPKQPPTQESSGAGRA